MNETIIAAWIAASVSVAGTVWNFLQLRPIIRYQTNADAKKLIHKYQFEKEFSIYTELWSSLIKLRNTTALLRSRAELVDIQKTETERLFLKLDNFKEAFNAVDKIFEHNRPFYSVEIYTKVLELLMISGNENLEYITSSEKLNAEYWEKGLNNVSKIHKIVDEIEQLIRKRIEVIQVA